MSWGIAAVYLKMSTRWRQCSISTFSFFTPLSFLTEISLTHSVKAKILLDFFFKQHLQATQRPWRIVRKFFFCTSMFICHYTVVFICMFDWGSIFFSSFNQTWVYSVSMYLLFSGSSNWHSRTGRNGSSVLRGSAEAEQTHGSPQPSPPAGSREQHHWDTLESCQVSGITWRGLGWGLGLVLGIRVQAQTLRLSYEKQDL